MMGGVMNIEYIVLGVSLVSLGCVILYECGYLRGMKSRDKYFDALYKILQDYEDLFAIKSGQPDKIKNSKRKI